jgi:hypothetical protein
MLSEMFWTGTIAVVCGSILKCLSMIYKSKCSSVDVCCIKIVRNTEAETKTDELELKHLPSSPNQIKRHGSDSSL